MVRDSRETDEVLVCMAQRLQGQVERQLTLVERLHAAGPDDSLADLAELRTTLQLSLRGIENLLVLGGAQQGPRSRGPRTVAGVLADARAGVDDAARIDLRPAPDASIAPRAVGNLVALFTELLSHALTVSPGLSGVEVTSRRAEDGGVLVEVATDGAGPTPGELDELNRRLADRPIIDDIVSNRVGLFVAARIAARSGVTVRVQHRRVSGHVAVVHCPPDVLDAVGVETPRPWQRTEPGLARGRGPNGANGYGYGPGGRGPNGYVPNGGVPNGVPNGGVPNGGVPNGVPNGSLPHGGLPNGNGGYGNGGYGNGTYGNGTRGGNGLGAPGGGRPEAPNPLGADPLGADPFVAEPPRAEPFRADPRGDLLGGDPLGDPLRPGRRPDPLRDPLPGLRPPRPPDPRPGAYAPGGVDGPGSGAHERPAPDPLGPGGYDAVQGSGGYDAVQDTGGHDRSGRTGGFDTRSSTGGYDLGSATGGYDLGGPAGGDRAGATGGYDAVRSSGGYDAVSSSGGYDSVSSSGGYDAAQSSGGYDAVASSGYESVSSSGGYDTVQSSGGYDALATAAGDEVLGGLPRRRPRGPDPRDSGAFGLTRRPDPLLDPLPQRTPAPWDADPAPVRRPDPEPDFGGADELFGPLTSIQRDRMRESGPTPIYEAVASAWFVEAGDGDGTVSDWTSPGDAEWRAASERASRQAPEQHQSTAAGLPRRRPGTQMVAPPRHGTPAPAVGSRDREPERVRERLAVYQQGLERGRHRASDAE